ncbi:multisubunit sodium/proton antiporter, MrpE subunit [Methanolobus vulcani]|jgi:multicomponent Na+:H+ antiporter subunit E|uniref:Multisubunit sodium/proton antiporter, MrpE subunit n=1 Tax=Methanolobus vulcani TaxID=38026 RepID=A0A7Z7FFF4_9EURY|nr:Na+/H+ antiporter subunit E [Methanolobus vulcani]MDK2825828.1 multicomponent Na+:H+ antiporter subunit [Methanolobus sp.]MDK2947406.1 multicomponent Na+:H+ antiporter subunit [Methanolobus sp.]SDG37041.1 multisubunit sodium/proton antiporter, MrpE subunit [Methanolobus vulcani]
MKRYIAYSAILALVWCFVHGTVNINNFILGLIIAPFVIRPFKTLFNFDKEFSFSNALSKIPAQIKYLYVLIVEIIKANIMVAKIVLQPKIDIKPGIIAVPIDTKTDLGITAIANTITLTPGTLTIDMSDDRCLLYVHAIDATDPEGVAQSIKDDLEKYVLEAFE